MRDMPRGEMQALIARADARLTAGGPRPPQAPVAARPAPAPQAAPAARPARPAHVSDEPTDDDDDIRTIMRTPEQMAAESAAAGAGDMAGRTMMLEPNQDPWQVPIGQGGPAPAAGRPAGWLDGPVPMATMALPSSFEPASPGYADRPDRPERRAPAAGQPAEGLAGAHGTQKIPPGFFDAVQGHDRASAPNPSVGFAAPQAQGGPFGAAPQPLAGSAPPGVMGAAPQQLPPWAVGAPLQPQTGTSKKALVLAALIALIVAAAATFALLKLRGI